MTENESLARKLNDAAQQLSRFQAGGDKQVSGDASDLQQQLNSERLKTGELQIQLAELKKRIGQNNDTESLYSQIEELREKNKTLEIQLAGALNGGESAVTTQSADGQYSGYFIRDWKRHLLYFFLAIIFGMGLGIFAMDHFNRRRHGGFRV